MQKSDTEIYEIIIPDDSTNSSYLSYRTDKDTTIGIIILNEVGQSVWSNNTTLPADREQLDLDLPHLSGGTYNAWIEVKGKTFIRTIVVKRSRSSGFMHKIKALLGL